jgi:hypothetical protein
MGYDLHIARKEVWHDDGLEISMAEWELLIATDPEMRLDGFAEAKTPNGSVLRINDPSLAVWVGHPEHGTRDGMAWFWLSHGGNITAKNPDEPTCRKMWSLAQTLGAKVQGDEGDLYGSDGQAIDEPEPLAAPSMKEPESPVKPWWRFW